MQANSRLTRRHDERTVARPCRQAGRVCIVRVLGWAPGKHGQAFAMPALHSRRAASPPGKSPECIDTARGPGISCRHSSQSL